MDDSDLAKLGLPDLEYIRHAPQGDFQDQLRRQFENGTSDEDAILVGAAEWMAEQVPHLTLVNHMSNSPVIREWCSFLASLGCPKNKVLDHFTHSKKIRTHPRDGKPATESKFWNFAKRLMDITYDGKRAKGVRRNKPVCHPVLQNTLNCPSTPSWQNISIEKMSSKLETSSPGPSTSQRTALPEVQGISRPRSRPGKAFKATDQKREIIFLVPFMRPVPRTGGYDRADVVDHTPFDEDSPYRKRQKLTERLQEEALRQTNEATSLSPTKTKNSQAKTKARIINGKTFLDVWKHDRWRKSPDQDRDDRRERKAQASRHQRLQSPDPKDAIICRPRLAFVRTPSPVNDQPLETGRLSPWYGVDGKPCLDAERRGVCIGAPISQTDEERAVIRADVFLDALASELTAKNCGGRMSRVMA
ncbi:hypothetical protein BN1708_008975 [Verticillium longisporum]|uniref:Uncharacterized protein n=1 Tax=Verticillium longisporum TaxID=100787 RepID=A0A0G4N9I4_VERLO|nr:hypothetical protein BN1708_008975 [Verticillium longisporum]